MNTLSRILKKSSHSNIIKLICITGTTAVTLRHLVSDSLAKGHSLNEKLVGVHLFSRHGARTPLYLVNGIEEVEYQSELLEPYVKAPYILKDLNNKDFSNYMSHWDKLNFENKLKGGAGRGQLTKVGEKQLFDLGRRVHKRYIEDLKFLSPDYDPTLFYSRSSHFRRTINSAKCFLAGVFNKEHDQVQKVPFVINVDDLNTDYIFPNSMNCSYYSQMHKFISKLDLFSKDKIYIKHLEELNAKVPKSEKENFMTFTKLRDDLIAREIHNLPVPDHLKSDFEKSHELASKELSALSNHSLKLSCGRLLNHIINNLSETLEKDSSNEKFHKFRYYSVHDTTLNALMNSFELIDENNEYWPPFGADIVIELWKELEESTNKESHFVRLFYCGEPMCLIDGSLKCSLENFIVMMKRHEVSCLDHYNYLCNQTFIVSNIIEEHIESTDDANIIENNPKAENNCFVAVHIGAGFHSEAKAPAYRSLCENICSHVIQLLNNSYSARDAVAAAVALLEDSPLTNAGVGSNLNLIGKVECDASIMDLSGFGSVGAITNIKNPIMAAHSILKAQDQGFLSMGRIVPCMLIGEGAKLWAISNDLEEVDDDYHKTDLMIKTNTYYLEKLENDCSKTKTNADNNIIENMFDRKKQTKTDESHCLDTVGAICLDSKGNLASAISSGGIIIKCPGRVGQASMFGCGCYVAQSEKNLDTNEQNSIAICTTGCGEHLIKTLFAKECADHILKNNLETQYNLNYFYKTKFFNSPMLRHSKDKLVGAMICKLDTTFEPESCRIIDKSIELIVTHTTPSMGFGFMGSNMNRPKSIISRQDKDSLEETFVITSFNFNMMNKKSKRKISNDSNEKPEQSKKSKFN